MEAMTLEQISDILRSSVIRGHDSIAMADAIDAHLAQPAQAVDAYDLAAEIRRVDSNHNLSSLALSEALIPFLTRALSSEKAGPVGDDLAERLERAEASAEHNRMMRESDRRALAIVIHHFAGGSAIVTPAMLDELPAGITRIDRPDIACGAVELRTKDSWRDFREEIGANGKPTGYLIFPASPTPDKEGA